MIRTIVWFCNFGISVMQTLPKIPKARKLMASDDTKEFEDYVFKVTSHWANKQLKCSGSQIIVHNAENIPTDTNVLFVSNHQSNFDIPIFMSRVGIPKGFLAKIELKKLPGIRTWMELMGCVFMDRNDMKQSLTSIIEGINLLKSGRSMVVFPEGTRSKQPEMGEFKPGSFKLATKSKVPIVPVTIDGSYKIMEMNHNKIKPAVVNIYIHPPILTSSLTKDQQATLAEDVKKIIQQPLL